MPFEANPQTIVYLQTWLLFCCRSIEHLFTDKVRAQLDSVAKTLDNPKLPVIVPYQASKGAVPTAIAFLHKMCCQPITSEYQLPASGAQLIFEHVLLAVADDAMVRKMLIDELFEGMKEVD